MGIVFGTIIGFLASFFFYRVDPVFSAILGGSLGYLLQSVIHNRKLVESLENQLKLALNRINSLVNNTPSKTHIQEKPETVSNETSNEDVHYPVAEKSEASKATQNEESSVTLPPETIPEPKPKSGYVVSSATNNKVIIDKSVFSPKPKAEPNKLEIASKYLSNFFTGENAVLRIGIIILFLGIAFLLKYAAENSMFPVWLRLVAVSIGALVLFWLGWRLKDKRESYALGLQGAAIGILYLDIMGALKLTDLLPPVLGFILLIAVCAFSAILAITQNSKTLATMGAIGGFLAPILASTGGGKYYLLFSYYLLLNSGILAIAWYKTWRSLNLVGFFFTFSIGLAWGIRDYQADIFWNIEFFLLAFFIQFLLIAILFAIKQPSEHKAYVDGTLVFGMPLLVFALQTYLLKTLPQPYEFGMAFTALGLAVTYIYISLLFTKSKSRNYALFSEATLALGVMFATLTIPLALNNGLWTSAAWALEGSALLWLGTRQNRMAPRLFGIGLQFLAGFAFLIHVFKIKIDFLSVFINHLPQASTNINATTTLPVINSLYLGCLIIVIAGLIASYILNQNKTKVSSWEHGSSPFILIWALIWWFASGINEVQVFTADRFTISYALIFLMASCLGFYFLAKKLSWSHLKLISHLAPIALVFSLLFILGRAVFVSNAHPSSYHGFIGWPVAFILFYVLFFVKEKHETDCNTKYHHTVATLILLAVLFWEIVSQANQWLSTNLSWNSQTWLLFTVGATLTLFVAMLIYFGKRISWPFKAQKTAYLQYIPGITLIAGVVWISHATFFTTANPAPLKYVPLINPIELCQAFMILTAIAWYQTLKKNHVYKLGSRSKIFLPRIIGVLLFLWFNAMLVRTLGHWGEVPFDLREMMHSSLAQATFSMAWTLLALFTMFYATRKIYRGIWMGGAIILVLVIAKLFLVDLANIGTLGRIISFIGVGTLLLLIGYLSPLPPKPKSTDDSNTEESNAMQNEMKQ